MYIAGLGMITPLGINAATTAAAVRASISRYRASDYNNRRDQAITLATVPDAVFDTPDIAIDEGDFYCERYDRIIKMAVLALRQAVSRHHFNTSVPLFLAMSESSWTPQSKVKPLVSTLLTRNLVAQKDLPSDLKDIKCIGTGRVAGLQLCTALPL